MRANEFTTPSNLVWKIRFERFKNIYAWVPEREDMMFFMPFDSSALRTFYSLTGKDYEKISNMPTEVYEIIGDATVSDMKIFNKIIYASEHDNPDEVEKYKEKYVDSMVPYNQYKPGMFAYPEVMAEPSQVRKITGKGVTYDKNTGQIKIFDRKQKPSKK